MHSNKAAHSRAHLHAIQSRKKGVSEEQQPGSNNDMDKKVYGNNLELCIFGKFIKVKCEVKSTNHKPYVRYN